jgi:hypothetical protein
VKNINAGDRRDVNPRRAENSESDDKAAELDTAFDPEENSPEKELKNADAESADVSGPCLVQSMMITAGCTVLIKARMKTPSA